VGSTKLLCLVNYGADYGEYFALHGLARLLGPERIITYPFKKTYLGEVDTYPERFIATDTDRQWFLGPDKAWGELWNEPSLFRLWEQSDHAIPRARDSKPEFYQNIPGLVPEEFDKIVSLCRSGEITFLLLMSPRWFNSSVVSELRVILGNKCPPCVIIDSEDYLPIRWDFVQAFEPLLYFKRTFYDYVVYEKPFNFCDWNWLRTSPSVSIPRFHPLPFSSTWDLPYLPWENRTTDLFCVFGATQVLRRKIKDIAEEVGASFPGLNVKTTVGHPWRHDEYMQELRKSRVVVDHQRLGTDTVRLFEALSVGACVVSDLHIKTPHPFIPDTHLVQYENDLTPEGDKQRMDVFRATLVRALTGVRDPQGFAARIARAGYDHCREHHTTLARARYILETVKNAGIALGDLMDFLDNKELCE